MGLKLTELNNHRASGELDGQPFELIVENGQYYVRITSEDAATGTDWTLADTFVAPASARKGVADRVRSYAYAATAKYRQFQRFGTI
ncbi:hypothetical protein [Thioclava sp. FTW29]|uniref:Uncharacterized protein n=1 Tax=Thioclava litoralis TaxID=3076557 RepID=A0ABZ1E6B4_9RHOB|nr:hypothetical protein RPE78_14350 [Thioclava sp. FTW29]